MICTVWQEAKCDADKDNRFFIAYFVVYHITIATYAAILYRVRLYDALSKAVNFVIIESSTAYFVFTKLALSKVWFSRSLHLLGSLGLYFKAISFDIESLEIKHQTCVWFWLYASKMEMQNQYNLAHIVAF
ncbi:hypothetical protein BY458DRAFT_488363 [Sporodiniella umbellata]|nr:hypothetical protein BY458DRAFT_488363 [Sporodiniella umbellata]